MENEEKKNKKSGLVVLAIIVIVMIAKAILANNADSNNPAIEQVKNGFFYTLPDVTIEKLYDSVFKKVDWSVRRETGEFYYVDGSGYNDSVFFKIQFEVDLVNGGFRVYDMQIENEVVISDPYEMEFLIAAIIEEYQMNN